MLHYEFKPLIPNYRTLYYSAHKYNYAETNAVFFNKRIGAD